MNASRRKTSRLDLIRIGLFVCLLYGMLGVTIFGQSGRRGSKSPPVSVPTPEVTPETKPRSDQPRVSLLLSANRGDTFAGIPFNIYDSVLQSCAARLKESEAVSVEVAAREMTRSDAINQAKAAKEGYVIWLNLRLDQMGSSSEGLDGVYIDYLVLEAITAKVRTQGNSYQGSSRAGGVVLGPTTGNSSTMVVERRLRVAAEDAAARILKALHIASASDIPPH